jgi:hypothetical protein
MTENQGRRSRRSSAPDSDRAKPEIQTEDQDQNESATRAVVELPRRRAGAVRGAHPDRVWV